ncbi:MAG: DUF1343 domain-containing protein [Candidatus Sumerlaeia bacterium]|nr:DUF1343 domain-containing protein [Candidatus Sumerlaeia bacterium]
MRFTFHSLTGAFLLGLALFPSFLQASSPHPLEVQIDRLVEALEGKRVGLLTNPTGVDSELRLIADRLHEHPDVDLVAFFAPEHGIRGDRQAGAHEQDFTDPATGIIVYSLYGPRRAPTAEQLADLDVVVYDIQDVGARFYTYVWTMTHAMEACAAHDKEFVVFDRPNPIGLNRVEGAPNDFDAGLIGRKWDDAPFGLATRHGMTAGEVATLVNEEWMSPKVDLTVVKVPGLTRSMSFADTGYPWVFPSPNMPTLDTSTVYPWTCVFEGGNISEGRGTTRPFELFGAPWIDGAVLADALNDLDLPGCRFRPAWFRPTFSTHSGSLCGGVQLHVTDADAFRPVETGLHALKTVLELYPEETTVQSFSSRLMGVEDLHTRILTEDVDTIVQEWEENLEAFMEVRARHLLYTEDGNDGWMTQ